MASAIDWTESRFKQNTVVFENIVVHILDGLTLNNTILIKF